ncbi:MAG TPA: helix-turn-helix domain-containing protein [Thermodesulfobacteriota bacterium]|nr:helix-turn-helix domain-containing protein [Thermodesulfobacteriota bacterium]
MKKLEDLNYYELLEVAFDASPFEVHQAYKEMTQLYQDDSLASYSFFSRDEREKILAKLDEAYSALMDEKRRSQYDQLLIERGILEKSAQYQGDQMKLGLMYDAKRAAANTALRIRDRLKPIVSSNPVIQEILANDALSGRDLKKIRDELGVSLEEISELVKVRVVYLHAIEDDQFEKAPSRLFLKGFLRAYAQCIGLDADMVASRYLKRIHD